MMVSTMNGGRREQQTSCVVVRQLTIVSHEYRLFCGNFPALTLMLSSYRLTIETQPTASGDGGHRALFSNTV